MGKKNKKVSNAEFSIKNPKQTLTTDFSSLTRYSVVNQYKDGSVSKEYDCDIVTHRGVDGVGIMAYSYIDNELNVLLIQNFRAAAFFRESEFGKNQCGIDTNILEFIEIPAGSLEDDDTKNIPNSDSENFAEKELPKKIEQAIKKCAARELMEECGLSVAGENIHMLGSSYYAVPGLIAEKIYLTCCDVTGKKQKKIKTDGSVMEETIEPFFLPFNRALEYCRKGIIKNAVTEIALYRLYDMLVLEKERMHTKILSRRLNRMNSEIRNLKNESAHYNKLIREFRASITHELKHPVTEVLGYVNILSNQNTPTNIKKQSLEIIKNSVKKIYENNSNLIKLAIGTNAEPIAQTTKFNVYNEVKKIVEEYKTLYSYSVETSIIIDEQCKELIGLRDRFSLILEAVISNAMKFTKKGNIEVNVRLIDKIETKKIDFFPDLFNYHLIGNIKPYEIEITVKDTGIGIKPSQLKKVFIPFYQSDHRFTREYGGMGIGLYIVHDLVESMQGRIELDSSIGVGTTVKLRIPFGIAKNK